MPVRINWRPAKVSQALKEGDIISCSGKGRLKLETVTITKKGKFSVEILRSV